LARNRRNLANVGSIRGAVIILRPEEVRPDMVASHLPRLASDRATLSKMQVWSPFKRRRSCSTMTGLPIGCLP
jgi:hypothetical protein